MIKLDSEPSFIIHTRAFRETSLIADVLTLNEGRISVIAKGAKRPKSKMRGFLNPFCRVALSATGKGELLTVTGLEPDGLSLRLGGKALLSGLYLNELLYKVLPKFDDCKSVFEQYQSTLQSLVGDDEASSQFSLRLFEYHLLKTLGYGFDFQKDVNNNTIELNRYYDYNHEHGFVPCSQVESPLKGEVLQHFAAKTCQAEDVGPLKWLMRKAIQAVLNGKTLHCRELVQSVGEV